MSYDIETRIKERELQFVNDLFEIGSVYSASHKSTFDGHYDILRLKGNLEMLLDDVNYVIEAKKKLNKLKSDEVKQSIGEHAVKEAQKEKE